MLDDDVITFVDLSWEALLRDAKIAAKSRSPTAENMVQGGERPPRATVCLPFSPRRLGLKRIARTARDDNTSLILR